MRPRLQTLAVVIGTLIVVLPGVPARADEIRNLQWHLGFLDVADAHRISQGAGVIVAVIDTGVDASHPDLVGNVLPGMDFVDNGGNGQRDEDGHGTAMAGLVAAHGRGGDGVLGIAPKAKILPVRTTQGSGVGSHDSEGIAWAAEHGAKVICLASGGNESITERREVANALSAGVVVVAAVGNRPSGNKVAFPAAYPGVLAAAGVDRNGNHAEVSVTGPEVVLSAPAVDIVSTDPGPTHYRKGTGTSDATAILAGAAALVRAKYPNLSAEEVIHRLTATAIDKGPPGRDSEYGYGVVDLVGALTKDVPPLKASATPSVAGPIGPSAGTSQPSGRKMPIALIVVAIGLLIAVGAVSLAVALRRRV